ncbi:MAG: hypothetical protein HY673_00700 [Chloroflexi bacterium]|nr:hypothetical protein [Chloroflexota bacterium]
MAALRQSRELAGNYGTAEKAQSAEEPRFLGYDSYGYKLVDAEKRGIDALMGYTVADGRMKAKMPLESLFAPGTI